MVSDHRAVRATVQSKVKADLRDRFDPVFHSSNKTSLSQSLER